MEVPVCVVVPAEPNPLGRVVVGGVFLAGIAVVLLAPGVTGIGAAVVTGAVLGVHGSLIQRGGGCLRGLRGRR